jgi:micrococcal nuclease
MKLVLAVLAFVCCLTSFAQPDAITGRVKAVIDGNTIMFQLVDEEEFKFALAGIDAPELNQPFGQDAKDHLEKLLLDKEVTITIVGKDRLGVRFGVLLYGRNKDPRKELLEKGLAWTAEKNLDPTFAQLQQIAKSRAKGLWQEETPMPPWVFRRQQTMLAPKAS